MGRNKWRVCRDSGLPHKRDTPVKPALGRREKLRRLLPCKVYEEFPEEPEVEEIHVPTIKTINPIRTSIKPVHCKSVLHLSRPDFSENPRHTAVLPATPANKKSGHQVSPAGHPTIQMIPDPEAFKSHSEIVKEEEQNCPLQEEQNLAGTPESAISSSSMESDTIFNCDDDEDCYSSASSSSSSLPSPEIFRRENDAETVTFPSKAELLGLHPNIRNSTLLDVSHARSICMHQPPNLSAIIDASTSLAEKCEISNNGGPEAETQIKTDSFKSDKEIKCKTPAKLTKKRPILCKKKVIFKSPIIAEILEVKHTPTTKCTIQHTADPVHTSSPADQMKPGEETSRAGEINSKDDTLLLRVTLKRPVKSSPEKAKFFDFVSDNDEDVFFQMMRERSVKLRRAPLFPLTAAKHTVASVL